MSSIETLLLDDIRASLIKRIRAGLHSSTLEDVFAAWLVNPVVELDQRELNQRLVSTGRKPSDTAALGFQARSNLLEDSARTDLLADLEGLLEREPVISGTPMPFCMDALSLGGVLIGVNSFDDQSLLEKAKRWISSCRDATANGRGLGSWQEAFIAEIAELVGCRWPITEERAEITSLVTVAMRSVGIGTIEDDRNKEADEQVALAAIMAGVPNELQWGEAVLRLAALDWIRRSRPTTDLRSVSIPDLCRLLQRASDALQYWTWEDKPRTKTAKIRKWDIDHEYHVQNLLWTMLSPVFPDLVPEDYTAKIGKKQPRADLGIPSMRLIVEAKFWYTRHGSKKMIEEIAQDTGLYLVPGSRYDSIVPFIWDEGRRTEEHKGLVAALNQMDGVSDAVVIAKPGFMK